MKKRILKILINKRTIFYWWLSLLFIIFILFFNYSYYFNNIKYKLITRYSLYVLDKNINKLYTLNQSKLDNDYNKKLLKLNTDYIKEKNKLNKKILNIKNKYKESIISNYNKVLEENNKNKVNFPINISSIKNLSFEKDIYNYFYNNQEKININKTILNNIETSLYLNKHDIFLAKKIKLSNKVISYKKEDKNIKKGKNFVYKIRKKDKNILILDKESMPNILDLWINFPSFFSYKANWIYLLSGYFDLHYWVDYKTTPKTYIKLYNFNNKKNKVILADYSKWWNKLVIWNVNKNWSERFEYLHLSRLNVKKWKILKGNELIGVTWKSWFITWPHLHFDYYKNGFYVPFDWWIDVDNSYILTKLWDLNKNEIKEIIKLWKENAINMEIATFIYLEYNQKFRNIDNLKKIVQVIKENEDKNKYRLWDFLNDKKIKNFFWKKTTQITIKNIMKRWDKFHQLKKDLMLKYLLNNKDKIKSIIKYNKNLLWNKYKIATELEKQDIKWKINYWKCFNFKSPIYDKYWDILLDKKEVLTKNQINNINTIIPYIYDYLEKNDISNNINNIYNTNINNCDLLYLELWKFYKWNNFDFSKIKEHWLFNIISENYKIDNQNYTKEEIKEQVKKSINLSYEKIKLLKSIIKEQNLTIDDDFLIKFWIWSFNWIINNNPNKDYYLSNNLFETKRNNNDGALTKALKLYFNK